MNQTLLIAEQIRQLLNHQENNHHILMQIKELKLSKKSKHVFEYNDLKTELTGQPNTNPKIAGSIINRAIKSNLARKELNSNKKEAENKK